MRERTDYQVIVKAALRVAGCYDTPAHTDECRQAAETFLIGEFEAWGKVPLVYKQAPSPGPTWNSDARCYCGHTEGAHDERDSKCWSAGCECLAFAEGEWGNDGLPPIEETDETVQIIDAQPVAVNAV